MKKFIYVFLLVLALGAAYVAGGKFGHSNASASGARRVLYYVDPMHPAYKSDKPGTAPDCGMELVPVYENEPLSAAVSDSHSIVVTPEKQQLIGVRTEIVDSKGSSGKLRLYGRVAVDENRVYVLNAGTEGVVREVSSVTSGAQVRKGDWLASVFSYESRVPIQSFLTTLDVIDAAKKRNADKTEIGPAEESSHFAEHRLQGIGMSLDQIEEMRRTRHSPIDIKITAPINGFVISRNTTVGQKFDKGVEWYRIANLDRVWIVADVTEADAQHIHAGQTAKLWLPSRYKALDATVSQILPQLDPTTRTFRVRLEAANPGYALRPDMYVDVDLATTASAAIMVASDAVLDTGVNKTVFVERTPGVFEPRRVETGERMGDRVQILNGLSSGERIVVTGNFLIGSEARLRAAATPSKPLSAAVTRVTDPSCGMSIDPAEAEAAGYTTQYKQATFHFCSATCKRKFAAAPEKYLNGNGDQHVAANQVAHVTSVPAAHHD